MAAPSVRNVAANASGTEGGTVTMPTHATDDIIFVFIETANEAISGFTAGWAEVPGSPQAAPGSGSDTRLTVYWKRATSASETAPTFNDPGFHWNTRAISVQGCRTSGDPWDATAGGAKTTASTSVSIAGVTTATNDCLVLYAAAAGTNTTTDQYSGWANGNLASVAEVFDSFTTIGGSGGGLAAATGTLATAGATGTMTATLATSDLEGFICIALAPPEAGPTVIPPDDRRLYAPLLAR